MTWSDRNRPAPSARGYDAAHRRARAAAIRQLERDGVGTCCLGGEPIYPGQALHLDHTPDRTAYRGLACAAHNKQDGARRGRARQTVTALRL